jgi:hypothetical protein
MCRVYFHVVRDGGAKEQLAGKKAFPTDELLQFYGCIFVSFVFVTLVCGAAALVPLPGTEEAGGRCPQILPDRGLSAYGDCVQVV